MTWFFFDGLVAFCALMGFGFLRRIRALTWRTVEGKSTASICERRSFGCCVARVHYYYRFEDRTYEGVHREPFLTFGKGWWYARHRDAGAKLKIKVHRRNPKRSLLVG